MPRLALLRYASIPLSAPAAVLIVTFTLLLLIAAQGGLLGLPLGLLVLSWFFKYGFAVLDAVADGAPSPPVLSYEMVNPFNEQRPLFLALIVGGFYVLTRAVEDHVGAATVGYLRVAAALLLPAAIAVLVVSNRVWHLLNPLLLARVALRLGADYLLIIAVVIVLGLMGRAVVLISPSEGLPYGASVPFVGALSVAVLMYGWLLIFALIGGAVFENRQALGFEPARSPERAAERSQAERRRELDRVLERIYREAHTPVEEAWRIIQAHARSTPDPIAELRVLLERTDPWPDVRIAERIAQELVAVLLAGRRNGEALDVVRARIRLNPTFRPLTQAQTVRLIELARAAGDRATQKALAN